MLSIYVLIYDLIYGLFHPNLKRNIPAFDVDLFDNRKNPEAEKEVGKIDTNNSNDQELETGKKD